MKLLFILLCLFYVGQSFSSWDPRRRRRRRRRRRTCYWCDKYQHDRHGPQWGGCEDKCKAIYGSSGSQFDACKGTIVYNPTDSNSNLEVTGVAGGRMYGGCTYGEHGRTGYTHCKDTCNDAIAGAECGWNVPCYSNDDIIACKYGCAWNEDYQSYSGGDKYNGQGSEYVKSQVNQPCPSGYGIINEKEECFNAYDQLTPANGWSGIQIEGTWSHVPQCGVHIHSSIGAIGNTKVHFKTNLVDGSSPSEDWLHICKSKATVVSDVWTPGYCGGSGRGVCGDGSTVEDGIWCSNKGTQADCETHCIRGGYRKYACCSWKPSGQCEGYSSLHIIGLSQHSGHGYKYMVPHMESEVSDDESEVSDDESKVSDEEFQELFRTLQNSENKLASSWRKKARKMEMEWEE